MTELLTDYGPITEIWFDIPWDMGAENDRVLADLYALVKKLQPDCLVLLNQGFVDGTRSESRRERTYRGQPVNDKPVPLAEGHQQRRDHASAARRPQSENRSSAARPTTSRWKLATPRRGTGSGCEGDAVNTLPTLYNLYQSTVGRDANLLLDAGPDKTGRIPAGRSRG